MKLWVDDIRPAPNETWTVAKTIDSAVNAISMFDFDEISLDHDISHQVGIGVGTPRPFPCNETFTPVAHYIATKHLLRLCMQELPGKGKGEWKVKVTLHTSNPSGAKKMEGILLDGFVDKIEIRPMGAANRLEMIV